MVRRSKSGPVAGGRGIRVADQLQRELAELLQREVKDPRIGFVTLTGVDLTPDYAVATVWFTVLPSDDAAVARALEGLHRAALFLRGRVGRALRIHTTPELCFVIDRSVERGLAMSQLIDEANRSQSAQSPMQASAEPIDSPAIDADARIQGEPPGEPDPSH